VFCANSICTDEGEVLEASTWSREHYPLQITRRYLVVVQRDDSHMGSEYDEYSLTVSFTRSQASGELST
jgi:hypothetical protein